MLTIANLTEPGRPDSVLDPAKLEFGKMLTPNFFVMEHRNGAWRDPRIQPIEPFAFHPATAVLHYAQTIFEGLKAYRHEDGTIVLFRPERNAERFRLSAERMVIPAIEDAFFLEAVRALVENERYFVPAEPGCLYIRPAAMGTEVALGVKSSNSFVFFVLTLPSGGYFGGIGAGPGAVDVFVSQTSVRSAPGITGSIKAGANYAGTLKVTEDAKKMRGCAQVLFLDAIHRKYVEEMGGMNVMFVQRGGLRTPPLTDTILDGVTRDSLLVLARERGLTVSEDPIAIDEVAAGVRDGSITEMFACGTAAVVVGIRRLHFEDGSTVSFPGDAPGRLTRSLYEQLVGIQYGRLPDTRGWVRKVAQVEPSAAALPR
ncbi:MAG: branched-chain amino acid aminotransferase [Acidimicrobiia bacterium]|nr:branched-chain amino acid aminotransferase [Acidimicrobiia bacterium]